MAKIPPSILLFLVAITLLHLSPTRGDPLWTSCSTTANFTTNSIYQSNLDTLLLNLTKSSDTGFATASIGQPPNQAHGLTLCRGDVNATTCSSCLNTASQAILNLCPNNKGAIIWYDLCQLHYSNARILSADEYAPVFAMLNTQNAADPTGMKTAAAVLAGKFINFAAGVLIGEIINWAAYNTSKRFATGEMSYTAEYPMIYGLVQCNRDLSGDQCQQCLQQIEKSLPGGKVGSRVVGASCNMRYEVYSFYDGRSSLVLSPSSPSPSPPPSPPPSPLPAINRTAAALPSPHPRASNQTRGNKKSSTGMILKIAIPLVITLLLISFIYIYCFRIRISAKKLPDTSKPEEITSVESILFDLSTLRNATTNFSDVNKLGEGGFGVVYKGILPNGQEIAVKRLSTGSSQGLKELKSELVLVAKLHHRNLVRLLGVCLEEPEKLLLYEYMPNRSLNTFLFDPIKNIQLNWGSRYKIIEGVARGLLYLHEDSQLKIIHRDLKTSNILLDVNMNPKISDFGLARLFGGDQTQGNTSCIAGTYGYMSPEYAMRGQFSIKSDVYSFGVLVLEILTGRQNNSSSDSDSFEDLLTSSWDHWTKGTIYEMIDRSVGEHYPRSEALRCIQIGLLCIQDDPVDRPTMSMVVLMLNSSSVSIQSPSRPTFCITRSGNYSDLISSESDFHGRAHAQSSTKSSPMSSNEVTISEIDPR